MELTLTPMSPGRSRAAVTSAAAGKAAQKYRVSALSDHLSISRQAVSYLREQDRMAQEVAKIIQRFTENSRSDEPEGMTEDEMLAEELKVKQRCQKIMARIMAGDKVPPKDMQYLAQNDMEGYKLAMAARMMAPKKKPKEWESVLEDEDETAGQTGGAEGAEGMEESISGGTEGAGEASVE